MYYFSPSTSGFYHSDLHGDSIPSDAFKLSEGEYCALVSDAPKGTVLTLNSDGRPERVLLAAQTNDAIERAWRNKALELTQWLVVRDGEELEMGEGTTLSAVEFKELLAYRQHLRDWPSAPDFPEAGYRPVEPDWLESALLKSH
ncbi:phage tail assembly chaperone [Pseudomonas sp. 10S4]|uniref:phage tail assembly chaperone n=1 Tax=Pseudomonas sp. 10S4 TaxID=3048583 RepID=UPI002AC9B02F|nr:MULTISPECIES: phage tail assembly chaperone [unclassified Pseudomonas]MEB0223649.1 phage tail assembly chaperone [Pseudomonas sp. 5S1]MEB0297144.1 phage tail assembly chaperone [Pseudomonas sp. 10S4]WPX21085.1 phage tail assembly chaperone [Pseudomonas sp. 10S4]